MSRSCYSNRKYLQVTYTVQNIACTILTFCIWEPLNEYFLLQTVKTQMKCSIMLYFIRVNTVCKGKKDLQTKEYNIFENHNLTRHPRYNLTMDNAKFIISKKPLAYKGLNEFSFFFFDKMHQSFRRENSLADKLICISEII